MTNPTEVVPITWSTCSSAALEGNPSSFHCNHFVPVVPNATYLQTSTAHCREKFEIASERELSDDDQPTSSAVIEVVSRPRAAQRKAVMVSGVSNKTKTLKGTHSIAYVI